MDGTLVRRVPGGIDCDRFDRAETRQEARRLLGWDPDRPAIFTARRLVRRMGLDQLVEAVAAVRGKPGGRDIVLHIAGSGPARPELERQVAELGLTDAVRLHGFVPDEDLALAYRAADLTLVPTAALEGFGLVAAESLAAGTPVMVTPIGGLPEVVSGLSPACVLAGVDSASIADGLLEFLRDPAILPDGRACSEFARRRYNWPVVISESCGRVPRGTTMNYQMITRPRASRMTWPCKRAGQAATGLSYRTACHSRLVACRQFRWFYAASGRYWSSGLPSRLLQALRYGS